MPYIPIKPANLVASLAEADPSPWAVAGRALNAEDLPAAQADIQVTAGTGTPEENETVAAADVVIHGIAADLWGYDGLAQAAPRECDMTPIRRTASGAVDTEYYRQQARQLRVEALRQMWRRLYDVIADFLRDHLEIRRAGGGMMRGVKRWLR